MHSEARKPMIKVLLAIFGLMVIATGVLVTQWLPATLLFASFTKWVTG